MNTFGRIGNCDFLLGSFALQRQNILMLLHEILRFVCPPRTQFGMQHFIQNCIQNVNIAIALNSFHCEEVILGEQS